MGEQDGCAKRTHFQLLALPQNNKFEVKFASAQRRFGQNPNNKLSFSEHKNDKMNKSMKGTGLLRKLKSLLPRSSLLNLFYDVTSTMKM